MLGRPASSTSCSCSDRKPFFMAFVVFLVSLRIVDSSNLQGALRSSDAGSGWMVAGSGPLHCAETEFLCWDGRQCVDGSVRCDGRFDCDDTSDELDCAQDRDPSFPFHFPLPPTRFTASSPSPSASLLECFEGEFHCEGDDQCLPNHYRCDGSEDCDSGSDEIGCDHVNCGSDDMFLCVKDKNCILASMRCDGRGQCRDGSDEDNCSRECDVANGGCSDICVEGVLGHYCRCRDGFRLELDWKTCQDVDECRTRTCSQVCENSPGSYTCRCLDGYRLDTDEKACLADGPEPVLWIQSQDKIIHYGMRSGTRNVTNLEERAAAAAAPAAAALLDFSRRDRMIYWIKSDRKVIYRCAVGDTGNGTMLIRSKGNITGLAYDWIHDTLYWTETGAPSERQMMVMTLPVTWHRSLLSYPEVVYPRLPVVDPRLDHGLIYWIDEEPTSGSVVVRKAGLDGSDPSIFAEPDVQHPTGMTIDFTENKLFIVDDVMNILIGLDLTFDEVLSVEISASPLGVATFEDWIYFGDAETNTVLKLHKTSGEMEMEVESLLTNIDDPRVIHVEHLLTQPKGVNFCGTNNGGCSHICLPSPSHPSSWFQCFCPDMDMETGYILTDDQKTCLRKGRDIGGTSPSTEEATSAPSSALKPSMPTSGSSTETKTTQTSGLPPKDKTKPIRVPTVKAVVKSTPMTTTIPRTRSTRLPSTTSTSRTTSTTSTSTTSTSTTSTSTTSTSTTSTSTTASTTEDYLEWRTNRLVIKNRRTRTRTSNPTPSSPRPTTEFAPVVPWATRSGMQPKFPNILDADKKKKKFNATRHLQDVAETSSNNTLLVVIPVAFAMIAAVALFVLTWKLCSKGLKKYDRKVRFEQLSSDETIGRWEELQQVNEKDDEASA